MTSLTADGFGRGGAVQASGLLIVTVLSWLIYGVTSGSYYDRRASDGIRLRVKKLNNGTFLATLLGRQEMGNLSDLNDIFPKTRRESDPAGALYYVVAVILMYGFSIILMIGSLIRKNKQDQQAHVYLKDMTKVRRLEKKLETNKTRLVMQHVHTSQTKVKQLQGTAKSAHSDALALIKAPEDGLLGEPGLMVRSTSGTSAVSAGGSEWSFGPAEDEERAGADAFNTLVPYSVGSAPASLSSSPLLSRGLGSRQYLPAVPPPTVGQILTSDTLERSDTATHATDGSAVKELCGGALPPIVITPVMSPGGEGENLTTRSPLLAPLPEVDENITTGDDRWIVHILI